MRKLVVGLDKYVIPGQLLSQLALISTLIVRNVYTSFSIFGDLRTTLLANHHDCYVLLFCCNFDEFHFIFSPAVDEELRSLKRHMDQARQQYMLEDDKRKRRLQDNR